jgi:hypothetical protein
MLIVRVTFEALPGLPMASAPALLTACPPAWLPEAMAAVTRKEATIEVVRVAIIWLYFIKILEESKIC